MSAALIIMSHQRDLADRFRDAEATSAGEAKSLSEIGIDTSVIFSRMSARGVFVPVGSERWWFDAAAWERFERRQGRRMLLAAVVILAACTLAGAMRMLW
jgi:hypothetical protein